MCCGADEQCDRVKVYDYPTFSDSFEKARRELEAAADSPLKGRLGAAQAVQSRVGLWEMFGASPYCLLPIPTDMAS